MSPESDDVLLRNRGTDWSHKRCWIVVAWYEQETRSLERTLQSSSEWRVL
jgi:hypothetical protein